MSTYRHKLEEIEKILTKLKSAQGQLDRILLTFNEIMEEGGQKHQIDKILLSAKDSFNDAKQLQEQVEKIKINFLDTPTENFDSLFDELKNFDNNIRKLSTEINSFYSTSEEKYNEILKFHNNLLIDDENKKSIKTTIEDLKSEIESNENISKEKKNAILKFYDIIFGDINENNPNSGLQKKINMFCEKVFDEAGTEEQIDTLLEKIKQLNSEYQEYYIDLNGQEEEKDENGETITAKKIGIKEETEKALSELKNTKESFLNDLDLLKTNNETERDKILTRIDELLPDAMGAGLASTYREAKEKHSYILQDNIWLSASEKKYKDIDKQVEEEKEREQEKWSMTFKRLPTSFKKYFFKTVSFCLSKSLWHYFMFLTPLFAILYINFYEFFDSWFADGKKIDIENVRNRFKSMNSTQFITGFISMSPLGIISFFGFMNIRRNNKLYDEYSYKEYVVRMYVGLEKELKDEEDKKLLTKITMEAIATRPSSIKTDETPIETMISSISNKLSSKYSKTQQSDEL